MYVGGVIEQNLPHLPTTQNFRGCLENVFINGINIIDKAQREEPEIRIPRKVSPVIPVSDIHHVFHSHNLIRINGNGKTDDWTLLTFRKRCILPVVTSS